MGFLSARCGWVCCIYCGFKPDLSRLSAGGFEGLSIVNFCKSMHFGKTELFG